MELPDKGERDAESVPGPRLTDLLDLSRHKAEPPERIESKNGPRRVCLFPEFTVD